MVNLTSNLKLKPQKPIASLPAKIKTELQHRASRGMSSGLNWRNVIKNYTLTEELMNTWSAELDWLSVAEYQHLSEEFIAAWSHKLDWLHVCAYQQLSEGFMTAHLRELAWQPVCTYQTLSEEFMLAHLPKLYLHDIKRRYPEFYAKHNLDVYHALRGDALT